MSGGTSGAARTAFTPADAAELQARGITIDEAARQLALLAEPEHHVRLIRPCTVGDGIVRLDDAARARYAEAGARAVAGGRCMRFVPASGAASRMFAALERARARPPADDRTALAAAAAGGAGDAAAVLAFLDGAKDLALWDALAAHVARAGGDAEQMLQAGEWRPLLDALLDDSGMGAASSPKGLLPFHRVDGIVRTAFDEQLVEAAALTAGAAGVARAHFTVSLAHLTAFAAALEAVRARTRETRFEVGFSEQHPSTDTLAADESGRPFRAASGRLLFRPAGHGALIWNLGEIGADLVLIKNIDNVVPDRLKGPTYEWSRILTGMAAAIEAQCHAWTRRVEAGGDAATFEGARDFHAAAFGGGIARGETADRAALLDRLARPVRVCGMVPNTGEPGGGPYFVAGARGASSPQIVESAQVRMEDPEQARIFREATHFNPVFIACALRDASGTPYDLTRFVDPAAVIVTRKSAGGRPLLALERPGLWNGAMAGWNSVFVEVPGTVFHPVKTLMDLLRPEHRDA